jgi:hypothetical protein
VHWPSDGRAVTGDDIRRVVREARARASTEGRGTIHVLPLNFASDETGGVADPRGLYCDTLTAQLHVVDAASTAIKTTTDFNRMSAWSSAAPTAARMLRSASSRSTMPPALMPLPFCQPNPSARSRPSDSARPIRQAILVEPMSSTPNGPDRAGRGLALSGRPSPFGDGSAARLDMSFMARSFS